MVEAARGEVGGEDKRRSGLSHRVDIWCENSICSSPVIVSQFPLFTHTHACAHTHINTGSARINSHPDE